MALELGTLVLRGREVVLRPLEPGDAPALAEAAAGSREHYGYNPVPDGPREAEAWVERALRQQRDGQRYPFAVLWNGRVVGSTSYADFQPWEWPPGSTLARGDRPDAVEIGYTWLAASAQRTRCNSEAKLLLLEHAFDTWSVHRVSLRTDERNARSRRAIERLGAKLDGIRRADMPGRDGAVRSSAYYSIVAEEWPAVRAALRARLESPRPPRADGDASEVILSVESEPSARDLDALGEGLTEHALPVTGTRGFRPLAVFARDRAGRLVGGVSGQTSWNWLHISLFWVAAERRGTGLGSRLLAAIEAAAAGRGCTRAHLDTFSYQARPFYERHGYELFATLHDYPPGQQRFFLRKSLDAAGGSRERGGGS